MTSTTPLSDSSLLVNDAAKLRELTYAQTMFCADLIGIMGGVVATIYYYGIEACLHFVWHTLPRWVNPLLPTRATFTNYDCDY